MSSGLKARIRPFVPKPLLFLNSNLRARDGRELAAFLSDGRMPLGLSERLALLRRLYRIHYRVECPHFQEEMLRITREILVLPPEQPGIVVEAGSYKGGSAAKLSIAAARAGRELVIFDSFEGIPPHEEPTTTNLWGKEAPFRPGDYRGSLDEVRGTIAAYGEIQKCRFVKGWFDQTMPGFHEPVAVAYIDVDLASSTRTCLKHLYPLLVPGGALFSDDGHLPLVREVFADVGFWRDEIGCPPPHVEGLGTSKLLAVRKPAAQAG